MSRDTRFPTLQISLNEMPGLLQKGKVKRELREAIAASTEMEIRVLAIFFDWIPEEPKEERTPYIMVNYIPAPIRGGMPPQVKARDVIVAALKSVAPDLAEDV